MGSEKDDMFIRLKPTKGRPVFKDATEPRTYSFFSTDINVMLNKGYVPKQVFRAGINALEGNSPIIDRMRELEEDNKKLREKLYKYVSKVMEHDKKLFEGKP